MTPTRGRHAGPLPTLTEETRRTAHRITRNRQPRHRKEQNQ